MRERREGRGEEEKGEERRRKEREVIPSNRFGSADQGV